ncbi:MAG: glycosyltransferase family 4 protein [Solirubrobacteraceae bacterium]
MPARAPLILTSSQAPAGRAGSDRPRSDFELLAETLGAQLSFPGAGSAPMGAVEHRVRLDLSQAVRARRTEASACLSLSERVGIPLSLLRPHAPHVVVAHLLTSPSKRQLARWTGWLERADVVLVFARSQERYLREEAGLSSARARFIFDKVDADFFAAADSARAPGYVLSVGREQRDYETLIEAVRPLRTRCIIVPGSAWSHRSLASLSLPAHVEMKSGLSYRELRELYQGAAVVVVPLTAGTDYAAGVNSLLEAMACARPTIVTATPGLEGYVDDRVDGRLVGSGDAPALRKLIEELLEDSAQAERLGRAGRQTVERERTTEHFVSALARTVDALA